MLPSVPLRIARLLTMLCLVQRSMADPFVSTTLHPDLTMEVAVEDVEVDAVDEVDLIVEDAVADVVALLPVEVGEEVLEVVVVGGKF